MVADAGGRDADRTDLPTGPAALAVAGIDAGACDPWAGIGGDGADLLLGAGAGADGAGDCAVFIAPLLALFGAAFLLKERITRGAVTASLVAFAGVAVIMLGQASAAPSPDRFRGTVAILISALCYAYNIVLMRQQALVAGPREVVFWQSVIVAALLALAAPFLAHVPDVRHVPWIVLAAVLATVSLMLLAWAYARGEASYLAPTEYTGFIWASLWGWAVFREPIALYTLAGAAMIVAGCLIAVRRRDVENVEAAF